MIFDREEQLQSPLELRFLEDCATVGLLVEPQFQIGKIHADFVVSGERVVIECDGEEWHGNEKTAVSDAGRNRIYAREGYAVIRIWGADVFRGGEELAYFIRKGVWAEEFEPGYLYKIYAEKPGFNEVPLIHMAVRRINTDV